MSAASVGGESTTDLAARLSGESRFEEATAILRMRRDQSHDALERAALQLALVSTYNDEDWTRGLRNHAVKHALLDELEPHVVAVPELLAQARFQRGVALHIDLVMGRGDPQRELASFTEAAKLFGDLGDQEGAALATAFIGIFHHVTRLDRETAEPILRRAYEMSLAIDGSEARSEAARHLGQIRQELGDPEGALPMLEESLRARAQARRPRKLPAALHAIGFARLEAGDYSGAADALARARHYGERYGCRLFLAMLSRTEADLQMLQLAGPSLRARDETAGLPVNGE